MNFFFHSFIGYSSCNIQYKFIIQHKTKKKRKEKKQNPKEVGATGLTPHARHRPFTILLQIQHENNFLPTSKHRQANFVAFLIFVCTTASFFAQISSSENVLKRDAILAPVAKGMPSYRNQSENAQKLLFTDLVNTKIF